MPSIHVAGGLHLEALMAVMDESFDPRFGEAWSAIQLGGALAIDTSFARFAAGPDHGCVGFSLCRAAGPEVELLLVAVRPGWRGTGVGSRLIDAAIADAAARRAEEMFLEVREQNQAALALYQSRGFAEVGRRPGYYAGPGGQRYSAITMRRSLSTL